MQDKAPFAKPGRLRLSLQFIGGMVWLALIAGGLAALSGHSFLVMYAATICGALGVCVLALMWLLPWAMDTEAPRKQFRLASAFYFITLTAMYLAAIRWAVVQVELQRGEAGLHEALPTSGVLAVTAGLTLFLLITLPWVLRLAESLMWLAVWLVRWPPMRSCLKSCLRRGK